jgi:hypothetical protein
VERQRSTVEARFEPNSFVRLRTRTVGGSEDWSEARVFRGSHATLARLVTAPRWSSSGRIDRQRGRIGGCTSEDVLRRGAYDLLFAAPAFERA